MYDILENMRAGFYTQNVIGFSSPILNWSGCSDVTISPINFFSYCAKDPSEDGGYSRIRVTGNSFSRSAPFALLIRTKMETKCE